MESTHYQARYVLPALRVVPVWCVRVSQVGVANAGPNDEGGEDLGIATERAGRLGAGGVRDFDKRSSG